MRRPDWPERLAAYVSARRGQPFAWGSNDCSHFARGALLAVGGPDIGTGWAGLYADEDGAWAAMRGLCDHGDLEAAMERVAVDAGLEEANPRVAQRGDLLLVRDRRLIGGMPLAAVCNGRDALTVSLKGVFALPMRVAARAWTV